MPLVRVKLLADKEQIWYFTIQSHFLAKTKMGKGAGGDRRLVSGPGAPRPPHSAHRPHRRQRLACHATLLSVKC